MGLSPSEKAKVLGAVNGISSLEARIEALEGIINSFDDVKKARERAEAREVKELEKKLEAERKAKEKAEAEARLQAAIDAEKKAEKALKDLQTARKAAGLED